MCVQYKSLYALTEPCRNLQYWQNAHSYKITTPTKTILAKMNSKLVTILFQEQFLYELMYCVVFIITQFHWVTPGNHTWLTYRGGKNFGYQSRWLWVKITNIPWWDRCCLVPTIKWEPLIQLLQNLIVISLFHAFHLNKFRRNFVRNSLLWRHNGCDGVSNHQPHHC